MWSAENTYHTYLHIFQNSSYCCIRKPQVITGGGGRGCSPALHPPPRSAPVAGWGRKRTEASARKLNQWALRDSTSSNVHPPRAWRSNTWRRLKMFAWEATTKATLVCQRFPSAMKKIDVCIFHTCPFSLKIFRGSLSALSFSLLASTMAAMGVFCQIGELKSTVGFPFGKEGSFSAQTVLSL